MKGTWLLVALVAVPAAITARLVTDPGPAAGEAAIDAVPAPAGAAASDVEWFWALNGPVSADAGGDMAVDAEGNVFIAGGHGGLDLDNDGEVDLRSGATAYVGANNPLFLKLGRRGSDPRLGVQWARSPATPADRSQTKVAVDGRGGAYVVGAFAESLAFEGGPTLRGAGGNDAFVARYDGDGSVIWARVFGGPGGGDAIYGLTSDARGNAYVVGAAGGTFPLDDRGAGFRTALPRAAAVVSYAPDGSVRWSHVFDAGAPLAFGVRVSPAGEVWVSGELEGAADFDGDGSADLPAPRDRDGFVARFGGEGKLLGAWSVPTVAVLAFAENGDAILAGPMGRSMERRYGPADFDADGRPDVALPGVPSGAWLGRFSAEGERRWLRSYALDPADVEIRGGLIAMSGNYKGVRDLDGDGQPERRLDVVDSSRESDLAILLVSARDGQVVRVWTAPGPGNDWANAVVFLPDRPSLLVTGAIQLTADFTGDGEHGEGWIVCENLGDLFVAQLRLPETERLREPGREIALDVTLAEREGRLHATLTWSGADAPQVDLFRNGEPLATVANDGSHVDVFAPRTVAMPVEYRVCDAGTRRCSAAVQGRR